MKKEQIKMDDGRYLIYYSFNGNKPQKEEQNNSTSEKKCCKNCCCGGKE